MKRTPATDTISRAFDSLSALPLLERGFLRHVLLEAIDDPGLATTASLAEHLYLVPQVVRSLPALAHESSRASEEVEAAARRVAAGRSDIVAETLVRLSHVALRDPAFLAHFLAGRPASPFL